ncbi:TonB-dependent receptor [Hydrocarboniphaga effusa]|jgi:iron complex outermembrane receptor protein|nr:TonB-dependent receptor [Hydrocarboniphaga effusa]
MGTTWKKARGWPALMLIACAAAQAQSADESQPAREPVSAIPLESPASETLERSTDEPSDRVETAIETVIVTGELLRREIVQTTSSVAVRSGAEIERSTARDVYDVIRATPNASLEDSDYGVGGMTLRGIGSYGASGSGAYASYGTTSVVVLDGVGLPRSALAYADLSAFDLDTVEIFRGPQSTSQGRNAMAGAVILNSVAPQALARFSPQLRGRFAAGEHGVRQYAGAAEATLWPDALAMRVVIDDRRDDGDITNATRDDDHASRRDSRSLRARLAFTPGGADGAYKALLSVMDLQRFQGSTYVPLANERSRVSLSDAPQDYDNQAQLYALNQSLRFGDAWELRAVSAWFRSKTLSHFDIDYGAESGGATTQWEDSDGFSQELRLSYLGERLHGTFGAYYYDEKNRDDSSGFINLNFLIGLPAPQLGNVVYDSGSPSKVKDMALFGELDWLLTERLTLTGGLRVDREKNSRVTTSSYDGDSLASRLLVASLQGSVLPPDGSVPVSREFSEVMPKLGLRYELFDGWFLGATYSEGYRPGGDGYNAVSGRQFSFDSERTQNTELSLKGSYRPWRVQSALNLFYTRWSDMQIQLGEGVDNYMGNTGPAYVRGGEFEFQWRAHRMLQLIGGYGVTWGRFASDMAPVANGADYSGNRLPKAPEYTGTVALEINPWRSLLIRPDITFVGSAAANSDNEPLHELPAFHLVNVAVRWQIGHFGLFFSGTNLTDETYRRDANRYNTSQIDVVSLGEHRRMVGGFELQF